jgi:hypothetical protein
MIDNLGSMKLVDLFVYAPYLLGSLFTLFIVWKLGKVGLTGARIAASAPGKTAGVLGTIACLFGTPVAFTRLIEDDPGMAVGSSAVGLFALVLSALALVKGKPADPLTFNRRDRKQFKRDMESVARRVADARKISPNNVASQLDLVTENLTDLQRRI